MHQMYENRWKIIEELENKRTKTIQSRSKLEKYYSYAKKK